MNPTYTALLVILLFAACSSVERDIETAMAGGEEGEEAMMRLSLAPVDVTPAVTAAASDTSNAEDGRVLLIEFLRRLEVRESDPRILEALTQLSQDPEPRVRKAVIGALGDIGQTQQLLWLIDNLATEQDETVLLVCLQSIATLGELKIVSRGSGFWVPGAAGLSRDQTLSLQDRVKQIHLSANTDTLRGVAEELLEKLVCYEVQEAEERELSADLEGAHQHFRGALELSPSSRNAIRRYALFLMRNGEEEKGMQMLAADDMMIKIPHRRRGPVIDGMLDDPVWEGAAYINRHRKTLKLMRTIPDDGNTHAYFVYTDSSLCVGMVRYGVDVSKLRSGESSIWKDDHFYVRIKTGVDENVGHVVVINPEGTLQHSHRGDAGGGRVDWDRKDASATHIGDDYWSVEFIVPFQALGKGDTKKGDAWVLNSAWGNTATSVHAEWIGNHGISSVVGGLALFD